MARQSLRLSVQEGATLIPVHLQPGASRDSLSGVFDGVLKMAVKAPPIDGAANERCRKLLARQVLHCPTTQVVLAKGARSRRKVFRVEGMPVETVRVRLAESLAACGSPVDISISTEPA